MSSHFSTRQEDMNQKLLETFQAVLVVGHGGDPVSCSTFGFPVGYTFAFTVYEIPSMWVMLYKHTYIHIRICIYLMQLCYIYIYIPNYTYIYIILNVMYVHVCTYVYIYIYMCVCVCVQIYTHSYTHIHSVCISLEAHATATQPPSAAAANQAAEPYNAAIREAQRKQTLYETWRKCGFLSCLHGDVTTRNGDFHGNFSPLEMGMSPWGFQHQ